MHGRLFEYPHRMQYYQSTTQEQSLTSCMMDKFQRVCPPRLGPMDAPFVRNTGPAAILSRFPSLLIDPALAHAIRIVQTRVYGPETG